MTVTSAPVSIRRIVGCQCDCLTLLACHLQIPVFHMDLACMWGYIHSRLSESVSVLNICQWRMERRYGQNCGVRIISSSVPRSSVVTPRSPVVTPRSSIVTPRSSINSPRSSILLVRLLRDLRSPSFVTPRSSIVTPRSSVLTRDPRSLLRDPR